MKVRNARGRPATHGQARKGKYISEYHAWQAMLRRCNDPTNNSFARYGGRGIKVCDEWSSFEMFFADMGKKPSRGYSLDRINNDGNYEPGNCRWSTSKEQNRNRSDNTFVTINGRTMIQAEACELYGISHSIVLNRIKAGWSVDEAFRVPIGKSRSRWGYLISGTTRRSKTND